MKHAHPHRWSGARGFTLIETVMVVVVLSIAAAAIVTLQGNIFGGQSTNKDILIGVQLMQECAERLLFTRRTSGYSAVNSGSFGTNQCGGMVAFGSYTIPSVTLTDPYSGSGCPSGGTCKLISITQGGLTGVTVALVNY